MNLATAGSPQKYGLLRSATSNQIDSLLKFSSVPKMTSSRIRPMGVQDRPGTIPWNVVRLRSISLSVSPNLTMVSLYRMLIVLPPSMSTRENLHENLGPATKVSTTSGYVPGFGMMLG